jgi:hypothetical protein
MRGAYYQTHPAHLSAPAANRALSSRGSLLARHYRTAPGNLTVLLSRDLGSSKLGLASRGLQLIHPDLRKRPLQRTDRAPVERFGPSSNCRASPAPIRVPALSLNKTTLRPEAQTRRPRDTLHEIAQGRRLDDLAASRRQRQHVLGPDRWFWYYKPSGAQFRYVPIAKACAAQWNIPTLAIALSAFCLCDLDLSSAIVISADMGGSRSSSEPEYHSRNQSSRHQTQSLS